MERGKAYSFEQGIEDKQQDRLDLLVEDFDGQIVNLTRLVDALAGTDKFERDPMLQILVQNMRDTVILFDRNMRVLLINDVALETIGIPSWTHDLFLTPDIDPGEVWDGEGNRMSFENSVMVRCIIGEHIHNFEQKHVLRDGRVRYFDVNASPIRNERGEVVMGLIVAREITELKNLQIRTERMLKEMSRQRSSLECLINNIPAGVILLDSDLKIITANRTYTDYFNQPKKWRYGAHISDVLPDAEHYGIVEMLQQTLETKQPLQVRDFKYDGFDKGTTYWNGTGVPVELHSEAGPVDAVAMVTLDVTEEISARARLAELAHLAELRACDLETERAQLNTIIQSIPVPLIVYDINLNVTAYNSAAMRLAEELDFADWLAGSGCLAGPQLLDARGLPMDNENYPAWKTLRGETCKDMIVHCRTESRVTRILNINSAPIYNSCSEITGAVMTMADVTEQMRTQERVREIYRREHAIADKLQASFLPHYFPEVEGFEIGQRYHPALDEAIVGGDFYDVFRISESRYGIVMADVAGKGLNAAVYTAMTKYMLRAYALENSAPEQVLARLNDALSACTPAEVFVTLVYGVLDIDKHELLYANAGHEQPILYCSSTQMATTLDVTGRALGLINGANYSAHTIDLRRDDIILLYTDGVTDAGWGVNRLGQERVMCILEAHAHCSVNEIADSIIGAAMEYTGGGLGDDAALLVIRATN